MLAMTGFKNKNRTIVKERENFVKIIKAVSKFFNIVFSLFNPLLKKRTNNQTSS